MLIIPRENVVLLGAATSAIGLTLGILLGYFTCGDWNQAIITKNTVEIRHAIFDEISNRRIEDHLRFLTKKPHIAGGNRDEVEVVRFIADKYRDAGFITEIHPYNVLLSYPDDADPNFVAIKKNDGTLTHKSRPKEETLDEWQNRSDIVKPFNAYAKRGDPEGHLVYVNFGSGEDFIAVSKIVDLNGKICIAKYGQQFRGNIARNAEEYNCSGLILYSDPEDYTRPGKRVYPEDLFLPGTGVQRGSLKTNGGDPLTRNYPSIDTAWRSNVYNTTMPGIPVIPIGYNDAVNYLSRMAGPEVPNEWRGGLNITYRYGPGFTGKDKTSEIRMHVTTKNERRTVHNVIGYIKGYVEPDRYVIAGNHHDAWVYGAIDPSSGTASMLEVVSSFGKAVKAGWKPRRTIVICSWGAEEYGVVGSTEWIEEFQRVLAPRTVAYINTDTSVSGTFTLNMKGSQNLKNMVLDAAKVVPNPNPDEVDVGRTTAYDSWFRASGDKEPDLRPIGASSDYATFLHFVGISCVDVRYGQKRELQMDSNPLYHTAYETFDAVKNHVDPDFTYHQAVARMIAEMTRSLVDTPLLPLNVEDYVAKMTMDMNTVLSAFGERMRKDGKINTDSLIYAVGNLTEAAKSFNLKLKTMDITDQLSLRAANDQLMLFERAFIDQLAMQHIDGQSHVIYAPNMPTKYGGAAFPGIVKLLIKHGSAGDLEWDEIRRQYSILLYHIGSAASTLEDFAPITGYSNKHSSLQFTNY